MTPSPNELAREEQICIHHWVLSMESNEGMYAAKCKLCKEKTTFASAIVANSAFPTLGERRARAKEASWTPKLHGYDPLGRVSVHSEGDSTC
jgi:hypothetical protein